MNLLQLTNKIKEAADLHPLVNQVADGSIYEALNTGDVRYPISVVFSQSVVKEVRTIRYKYVLYFVDRLVGDNALEIQTTAISVIQQIINTLGNNVENISIVDGYSIQPFTEKFADECAGAFVQFDIVSENVLGNCSYDEGGDQPILDAYVRKDEVKQTVIDGETLPISSGAVFTALQGISVDVRHDQTRDKNGNPDFLHVTQAEKDDFIKTSEEFENMVANATGCTRGELVAARDAGELMPGASYRITDYITTSAQVNTTVGGHQFDVIVTAVSPSELSENASAVQHNGDTYFANAKLEAWELKYCLDNDTNRFAWADSVNGKGVIYYMKDEWGNECPYDFKNIQFVRYPILTMPNGSTDLVYDVDNQKIKYGLKDQFDNIFPEGATIDEVNPSFYYTFNAITSSDELDNNIYDASIIQVGITNDEGGDFIVQNNKIGEAHTGTLAPYDYGQILRLNDIVINNVINTLTFTDKSYGCFLNTFGNNCYQNTFGNGCYSNTFGNYCYSNTFGNYCYSSTLGDNFYSNTFGNECVSNIFGNDCGYNTFGNVCSLNTFGYNCNSNTFGDNSRSNIFGNVCGSNTLGANCYSNKFGNGCASNTFGNECFLNKFYHGSSGTTPKNYIRYIVLEDGVRNNNFYSNVTTTSLDYLQRIRIKGLENTTTTDTIITLPATNTKYEWLICYTSDGVLKQYCPNDLTNNRTYKIEDTSVSTWAVSTKYVDFAFQAQINITDLSESDFVNVVFGVNEANSGNYAAAIEQYAGYILVFSKVNTAITIPTISVTKIDL